MISRSLAKTGKLARDFVSKLKPDKADATVVALYGDLGSGKTAFVKAVAKALGVRTVVVSPTFVIQQIYVLKKQKFQKLIHFDCYRIERPEEILHLGFSSLIPNPLNLIFIEWPEHIASVLPSATRQIRFKFIDEMTRDIRGFR